MSTNRLIVLAAGGTGGHVFPAEALARELSGRGYKLTLITDQRGGAYGGALGEIETFRVRAGGIAGKGPLAKVRSVGHISSAQSFKRYAALRCCWLWWVCVNSNHDGSGYT